MNIIMKAYAIIEYDKGAKEWVLFKRIDNAEVIPRAGDYIWDNIYEDTLEVKEIWINYEDNLVNVFLENITIDTREKFNKLKEELENKKWYLVED